MSARVRSGVRIRMAAVAIATVLVVLLTCGVGSALAAEGPVWKIVSVSNPTNFQPGDDSGDDAFLVTATNIGGGSTDGSTITIGDTLPAGLTAVGISAVDTYKYPQALFEGEAGAFTGHKPIGRGGSYNKGRVTCSTSPVPSCSESEPIDPGDSVVVLVKVKQEGPVLASSVVNEATVSGGGAASASVGNPVAISSAMPGYGPAPGGLVVATSTNQAGAHPDLTTDFFLNTGKGSEPSGAVATPKDIRFDLPPGLVGNTVGMPRCTMAQVINEANCPRDTLVGTATIAITGVAQLMLTLPVYNIAPAPGEPAAFAFNTLFFPVRIDTGVRSAGDYGIRVTVPDVTEAGADFATSVTIWGVPADHDGPGSDLALRNLATEEEEPRGKEKVNVHFGGRNIAQTRVPLLTNPSQCSEAALATFSSDSWEAPGVFASASASVGQETGCALLSLGGSSVSMLPDTLQAGAPAGYSFDLRVPQNSSPDGLATPNVKKVVATLPLGTVISPSAADGLGDCSDEQFGLHSGVPGGCPRESQVGTVQIRTPALAEPLAGEVYLASPSCDPCTAADAQDGRMVRLFVQVVGEGESGIVVKLEGKGMLNQQTGQLTTVFENNPQLPFSELELTLGGGERATLANPRTCGPASTTVDLTPWSTPYAPDDTPTSTFDVDEGCFGPQFDPTFTAGSVDNQAGEYSPFTLALGRSDSDEFLNGLQLKMPPGLLGMLSRVSLCGEPQAAQGTCGPESLIGHVTVETGPGADPFVVSGGQVFITGPYKGAPYGLSIVVPAVAGPYTLSGTTGRGTVVVRSAISVDPETAQLTVTADPLPTELDGIPLQLRLVNVTIEREGFTFNPTNCGKLSIGAVLTSTEAASASVSAPFQVTNCAALAFKPKFEVSTQGKTSRANGASLDAKVIYPLGARQSNIAQVKVELPKRLPSRLSTLQKACTAAVFNANPSGCPAASVVGTARASTPVLNSGLTGPVYFVSHGGEAFPSLIVVLQGAGVRVNLVGATFISKQGITSSTFKRVPDVPISSFELYLPEGPYSALAANGNLCTNTLKMPTTFTAQNGLVLKQSTPIAVTGCPRAKQAAKKAKHASGARRVRAGKRLRAFGDSQSARARRQS